MKEHIGWMDKGLFSFQLQTQGTVRSLFELPAFPAEVIGFGLSMKQPSAERYRLHRQKPPDSYRNSP